MRIDLAEFIGSIIDHVEAETGIRCYDAPDNAPSPLYSVELTDTDPQDPKESSIDCVSLSIHAVSEAPAHYSNAPVLHLVRRIQEAMAKPIALPEPYRIYRAECAGVKRLKRDPSGEGHAIVDYRFFVC